MGRRVEETAEFERYLYVLDGVAPRVVDGTRWQRRKKTSTSSDTINGPLSKSEI